MRIVYILVTGSGRLRNVFIRDVRGSCKELSAFSGGVLCAGGITKTLLATAMNAF